MALVFGTMGPLSSSTGLGYSSTARVQLSVLESFTEILQGKKCTLFKIVVKTPGNLNFGLRGKEWALSRRYTEFVRLNDALKKAFPEINLKVPGKRFFNNFDPMFVEHRRQGLDNFVQLLAKDQRLMRHALTQEFLQMDRSSVDSGNPESPSSGRSSSGAESPVNLGPSEKPSVKPSDFDFLKVIGKGSFGKVLLARHKSEDKVYAVKVLQKAQIKKNNEVRHIMSERNILRTNIQHPFLVGLHYSFQTRDKLYFVLDYVNGGELFHHLQRERSFSEIRSRFYAAEIASALGYLHSKKIIYRDLKPENLLLDGEGHIRLTDFGLCKENIEALDGGTTNTFCGTPEYLAPEILRKQPYTAVVDWWGLGAVLFEMLYGLPPFYSRDTAEMYDAILHKPLRLRTNVSEPARDLLEKLLQKEPKMRLGYEGDFEKIAAHHYFRTIDWNMLLAKQLKPPYNPHVSGNYDLRHIDHEFTSEPVPKSLTDTTPFSGPSSMDNTFAGFSYVPSCDNSLSSCL